MTVITSLKHLNGITVVGDGLAIDTITPTGSTTPIITEIQEDYIKIHQLTDHAVIGFSGRDLTLKKLKGYAREIKATVNNRRHPLALSDIAEDVIAYFKDKLRQGVRLDALIAGYEYDKDGKPCNPGYMRIVEEDGKLVPKEDKDSFSAAADIKDFLSAQSKRGGISSLEDPASSAQEAGSILNGIITDMVARLKNGHFIGGDIRSWNITKGGINQRLLSTIRSELKVGDELILNK